MTGQTVLSTHRLPQPYRALLMVFWLLPIVLIIGTILIVKGMSAAFFDPRFVLMLVLSALPALYIWQEGVDVLEEGIRTRIYVPRYYSYSALKAWHLGEQAQKRVLTIWDDAGRTVLQCHAAHLTEFARLKETLQQRVIVNNGLH